MNEVPKVRVTLACLGLAVVFGGFALRLVQLQVWQHDHYRAIAAGHHEKRQTITAQRGLIMDVHGEPLATNQPMARVFADPQLILPNTVADVAALIAPVLQCSRAEIATKLAGRLDAQGRAKSYVALTPLVPVALAETLKTLLEKTGSTRDEHGKKRVPPLYAASLRGIGFEQETRRVYPNGNMLCHVIGFTDETGHGVQGVEKTEDRDLNAEDGFRAIERDGGGHEIVLYRGIGRAARNGSNVRLTVDLGLQNIVETELAGAVAKYHPKGATVVMMRPQTGEIMAMANWPNFDANDLAKTKPEEMKNRAIIDTYEPGSTFKIVTVSGALNEATAKLNTMIFCENGSFSYGGYRLRDAGHHFGELSVEDVVAKSSNIGAAKVALALGSERFLDYIQRYGFGEVTGVKLPGEVKGKVRALSEWGKLGLTRIAIGQGISVTPLQMVVAMSAIANGGRLMMPQIVREISDDEGHIVTPFDATELRRVVSEDVAAQMRQALTKVVSKDGTAILASVPGYKVAGKTGTAQKVENKVYAAGKYVASFLGFMPADHPEFVCLVVVDEAKTVPGGYYGGLVAAPIFSSIAGKAASYLNIPLDPDAPLTPVTLANVEKD